MTWLATPEEWAHLAGRLLQLDEVGIDTETYDQPDRTSPQHRARVHCWSLGRLGDARSPRGFRRAAGVVLPRAALDHPELRAALSRVKLWAHNAPHDHHALANEGLDLPIEDTLQWLRVACPGMRDYGLKAAEQWALGYQSRPGFKDLVCYRRRVVVPKVRRFSACACGRFPCRARATSDWLRDDGVWYPHLRETHHVLHLEDQEEAAEYQVTDFVPGHPRWGAWLDYSLADAVRCIELVDWLRNRPQQNKRYPWTR